MNTGYRWLKDRRIILLPLAVASLTGCTTHVYNERVIIEDHSQPYQEQMSEDAGFPDPTLRDGMFEAKINI